MYMLKQKYFLAENNGVITIEDIVDKKIVCAFRAKQLNCNILEKLFYMGIGEEFVYSKEIKEHYFVTQVQKKYPELFYFCNSTKEANICIAVRQNLLTMKDVFISSRSFEKIFQYLGEYIEGKRESKVLLITSEDKYKSLFQMLKEISFIEIEKTNKMDLASLQDYAIVMSDLAYYESLQTMEQLKTKVLVFDVDKENIEVGPVVFTETFVLPKLEFKKQSLSSIQFSDEALLFFFIQRILFINAFELYNEIAENVQVPIRSQLSINKLTLEGYSKNVVLYPKTEYHGEMYLAK
ncbi:hypothetical protein CON64_21615 [Bacillus pseudomycoides]|nr:hypothetical protein CON64_21615 [Bacillus pseudomycoides]